MALRCDKCDQTILPTDSVCWHCGQELKPGQSHKVEKPDESVVVEERATISLTAVSVFALLTLITIILFILVTNALANTT